jgi:hypothetical protein
MKTKRNLTLTENASISFEKLRRNKDFLVFMSEVLVNGVTLYQKEIDGKISGGITIGIINK